MKSDNYTKESTGIELNQSLIDDFHRDNRLKPDNPDFEFYKVAGLNIDLNKNQLADSIILKRLKGWENDPGDFQQIQIKMDNDYLWTETNFFGWVRFDNNYIIPESIKKLNQLDTDLLLLTDFEKTKIIVLFGWVYASEPGLITIVEFSAGKPRVMVNKNLDLIGLDNKGIKTQYIDKQCIIEFQDNKIINNCK